MAPRHRRGQDSQAFRSLGRTVMAKVPMRWALVAAAVLAAGCVLQKTYDESLDRNAQLEREYQQLNEQMGTEVSERNVQITRLQDAIKVSVNSELLFPSG